MSVLLKETLHLFNKLRDTQVQLGTIRELCQHFPSVNPFLEALEKRERRLSKKAQRNIKKVRLRPFAKLLEASFADLKREGHARPHNTSAAMLMKSVDAAFRRTARLRGRIDPQQPRTIHRTRVAFKKFRYMVELLGVELIPLDKERIEEMRHYQNMMGEVQDADVLLCSLDKFVRKNESEAESLLKFREELLRRREWLIDVYLDAADQLDDFWPIPAKPIDPVLV